jgi:hypothetical protein
MEVTNPTLVRLEDQISWYDSKSSSNQRWYRRAKLLEILTAAAIPFLAVYVRPAITGAAGALVVVLEAVQHLYQFQQNWTSYRATCESLKHEKYLWLAGAGPYQNIENPNVVLADRVESIISQEHSKWIAGNTKGYEDKE